MNTPNSTILQRSLAGLGSVFVLLLLWAGYLSVSSAKPPSILDAENATRLWEGVAIGAALRLYAAEHNQKLPASIQALQPAYLGTNVRTARFTLSTHVEIMSSGKPANVVAAERDADEQGWVVWVFSDGEAKFQRPD
jgi:hypothetical protein